MRRKVRQRNNPSAFSSLYGGSTFAGGPAYPDTSQLKEAGINGIDMKINLKEIMTGNSSVVSSRRTSAGPFRSRCSSFI